MSVRASTDGIEGFTWWDAMENCVDGYREAIGRARLARQVSVVVPPGDAAESTTAQANSTSRKISRVNRALSSRLAKRNIPDSATQPRRRRVRKSYDPAETLWHLKNLAKAILVAVVFLWIFTRHLEARGRVLGWDEIMFRPTLE
jgi:hypothetical protein